jgi:hypothetical protein
MTLWHVGLTEMNAISWLHLGQSGENDGILFEDTLGMSAPPILLGSLLQPAYGE